VIDIWSACADQVRPVAIGGDLLRIVESQAQVATSALVDDLAEQALLEGLIETSKPPVRPGTEGLDYLLAAPFRYPPLRHGSRFGIRFEPGIFYASKAVSTVLAETAYYRLVFWTGMAEPPPGGRLLTQHTLLGARYRSERGLRLQAPPFDRFEAILIHPVDYGPTQRLGRDLRSAGVQAFEYLSARTTRRALNLALLNPAALASRKAQSRGQWLCETRAERVSFSAAAAHASIEHFPADRFLVDGLLPRPAA